MTGLTVSGGKNNNEISVDLAPPFRGNPHMLFQPRSLQQRTLFFILLPTFLLLVAISAAGFIFVRNILVQQWGDSAIAALQRTAHQIDMRLRRPKELLNILPEGTGSEAEHQLLTLIRKQLERIDGVMGVEIDWLDTTAGNTSATIPKVGVMSNLQHDHAPDTSRQTTAHYDKDLKNRTVSLVTEIKSSSGTPRARIKVSMSFDALVGEIAVSPWWKNNNKAYLIDDSGNVLASAAQQSQLEDSFPLRAFGTVNLLEEKTLAALRDHSFGTVFGPGSPPEEISGYYRLQEVPWTMVIIAPGAEVLHPILRFRLVYILSFTLAIILILVVIRITIGRVTVKIKDISTAADGLAQGRFGPPLVVTGRDEIGELTASFNKMTRQLQQRLRMKEDINLAREVQQNLLPQTGYSATGIAAAGISLYCDETGGDYFDIIDFAGHEGKVGVAVGDVVGHGLSAALLMTTVRALLRCRIAQHGPLDRILADVNRLLCRDTAISGNFVTLFYLLVDRARNMLSWVRAGHEPAIVFLPHSRKFSELKGRGVALGIDEQAIFQQSELPLSAEPMLILVGSDGLWEVENEGGAQFGRDRVKDVLAGKGHMHPQEIVDAMVQAITDFRGITRQRDDITLVVVKTW